MTKKTSYSDKLKDPRWQKKRLEILTRDNFTCQNRICSDTKNTLHVHHITEDYDIEPWEHEDDDLITLCEECHKLWHTVFNIPVDPVSIIGIVKLYDSLESEKIQKYIEANQNQIKQWPDQKE